jgi:hypothetical protein
MRAKEFVSEVAPFIAALGGTLARGAQAATTALAKGAVSQVGKQLGGAVAGTIGTQGTSGTTGSTATPEPNKPIAPPVPTNIPTGTKIEPVMPRPGSNPNELQVKIGDAVFSLDTKDPKNAQALTQLNQLAQKQS